MSFNVSLDNPSASSKTKISLMNSGMFSGSSKQLPKLKMPNSSMSTVEEKQTVQKLFPHVEEFDEEIEYNGGGGVGTIYPEPGCCHKWRVKLREVCGQILDCCLMLSRNNTENQSNSTHAYSRLNNTTQYQQVQTSAHPSRSVAKFTL